MMRVNLIEGVGELNRRILNLIAEAWKFFGLSRINTKMMKRQKLLNKYQMTTYRITKGQIVRLKSSVVI